MVHAVIDFAIQPLVQSAQGTMQIFVLAATRAATTNRRKPLGNSITETCIQHLAVYSMTPRPMTAMICTPSAEREEAAVVQPFGMSRLSCDHRRLKWLLQHDHKFVQCLLHVLFFLVWLRVYSITCLHIHRLFPKGGHQHCFFSGMTVGL